MSGILRNVLSVHWCENILFASRNLKIGVCGVGARAQLDPWKKVALSTRNVFAAVPAHLRDPRIMNVPTQRIQPET